MIYLLAWKFCFEGRKWDVRFIIVIYNKKILHSSMWSIILFAVFLKKNLMNDWNHRRFLRSFFFKSADVYLFIFIIRSGNLTLYFTKTNSIQLMVSLFPFWFCMFFFFCHGTNHLILQSQFFVLEHIFLKTLWNYNWKDVWCRIFSLFQS